MFLGKPDSRRRSVRNFVTTGTSTEHHGTPRKPVIFAQPGEGADAKGPYDLVLDRRKEDGWLDDTEPYHGARPRTTEVDRSVDDVLSATIGGTEQDLNFRDTSVPKLPPEQRIRQEEEVQTPPRREPRRDEGQQTKGPRSMINGTVLAPGALQTNEQKLLVETGRPMSGHLWRRWRIQCHVCSEIWRNCRQRTGF